MSPAGRREYRSKDKFATFRELRSAGGNSRLHKYEVQDDDIYDEVDEAEYHAKFRDREFEDEFVVDDDGSGYVDYGQDDFGEPYFESSDEDAEQKGKRRKKTSKVVKSPPNKKLETFFANAANKSTKQQDRTTEDDMFMVNLLTNLDGIEGTPEQPVDFFANATNKSTKQQDITTEDDMVMDSFLTNLDVMESTPEQPVELRRVGITQDQDFDASVQDVKPDILSQSDSIKFYWIDAQEISGLLYIFGKVQDKSTNTFVSCCVTVKNIERNLFILPRKKRFDRDGNETEIEVNFEDVIAEFDGIRSKHQIRKWGAKPVTRKYTFELPNIPSETEYLKVVYSFSQPQLPSNLTGETFSHIFGTNTSALELFLIKRKVMGPCWLEIKNATPSGTNISWCKTEIIIENPKDIDILKDTNDSAYQNPPPVTIMCFSLRTIMNPTKKVNEIVIASALVFRNVPIDTADPPEKIPSTYFTVVRQLSHTPYPVGFHDNAQQRGIKLEITRTERSLLNYLIAIIHRVDPDVLVGHNFVGFDLDVLLHRMKELKIDGWSKLGRLRRTTWPKLQTGAGGMSDSTYMEKAIVSGRLMCDTYLSARDLIKSKNYTLTELASSQLKFKREDIEFSKIDTYFQTSANLFYVIKHCENDAYLAAALTFRLQVLPLSKQLTNLAGNTWARTLIGGRAERNESLLLHEFHRNKYICPDKAYTNIKNKYSDFGVDDYDQSIKKTGRRKPAYAGGLVLEPKKGFYDKYVLLLDFNSLYPSIIQEYNICFTTISRADTENEERVPDIPDSGLPQGILPKLLASLVDRRRQVKRLLKDPHIAESVRMQYDIRQQALKLTANSMYGCLGFTFSRFYAKSLAMLITSKGREILQNTVDLAESERMEVIYGDTDSIMIYTNEMDLKKVREMGNLLKRKVNERYKLLEIEMDGFFRRMLLLKKKKYAALIAEEKNGVLETSIETKGLDLVRRDWCGLSHDASKYVLEQLLSPDDREDVLNRIHKFLTTLAEETRLGRIPTDKFVINKNLTKAPEDYADKQNQPHVQVALQMKKKGLGVRTGDTIPYVICAGDEFKETKIIADRARHPNDISSSGTLKIDYEWYLNQQVHPAVARLCEPIEGTDSVQIARCLGLDTSKFRVSIGSGSAVAELYTLDSQISDEERFVNADRFKPICKYCQGQSIFEGVNSKNDGYVLSPSGILCPNSACNRVLPIASLIAQLSCQIRWHITKYYEGWLVCDDEACRNRTRLMHGKRCLHPGCRGTAVAEYSDTLLYEQLLYLSTLFDVDKAMNSKKRTIEDQTKTMIEQNRHLFVPLKKVVDGYLDRCGRRFVDLNQLFSFCQT